MSKLALKGGIPVTKNLLEQTDLKRRKDLEREYLLEVYDSGTWDDWPDEESMAKTFQQEWAEFHKSKFCALLTNGTHTLQVALETLDIGAGEEVIVPGITWQATASAVCDVNAVPVLVDIDPETLCIDPAKIEEKITSKTRAIIPVHLYHRMADMDRILPIAKKHNLFVIEDCAHSHGSLWDGKGAGTLGDFGSFSFQGSKLVNAGEGGALIMQKEEYYWLIVSQRSCGREFKPGVRLHSGNYRMTSFQAAVLRGQLAAYRENADIINRNGLRLDKAIADAPGVKPLRRNEHITRQCGYSYAFLYDKEKFDSLDRMDFQKALTAELGIEFDETYIPLSHSDLYTPHLKKRHKLSDEYLKAITPSRWNLPVADDLWQNKAVVTLWQIYGCPQDRTHLLTDAISKIYENRNEILR
jgi:L-glutamine:2-deoxy-scyllo-inosose/3-amino-2,3-dideoxy-scyllo-inosose aminotransferase